MESDDDYQIFSTPAEPSSPIHGRELKRLKKAGSVGSTSQSIDQGQSTHISGSPYDADQQSTKTLDIGDFVDSVRAVSGSEGFDRERDSSTKEHWLLIDRDSLEDEVMLNEEEEEEEDSFGDLDAATEEFDFQGSGLINDLRAEIELLKKEKHEDKRDSLEGGEESRESLKTLNTENLVDSEQSVLGSEGFDYEEDSTYKADGLFVDRASLGDERILNVEEDSLGDFDAATEKFDVKKGDLITELRAEIGHSKKKRSKTEKKSHSSGGEEENKKSKKKRGKREGNDERAEAPAPSKRRLEKERKIHLEQLHAESQRLLRETRGVAFKPVPLVQKPISSVLEKIRQRKLEVLKMTSSLSSYADSNDSLGDTMLEHPDLYPKNDKSDEEGDDKHPEEADRDVPIVNEDGSDLDAAHVQTFTDPASLSHENILPDMGLDQEEMSKNEFLAPSNDTQGCLHQNISCSPQPSNAEDVPLEDQVDNPMDVQLEDQFDSPVEEAMAPSSLTMNLKLDPTPPDDISSDEEDNEKENIVSHPHKVVDRELYSKGDPVKAFVDDEAEEEDDSDNDLMRFQEDEEDDENGASEELNDLIVTGYKEKPIDNEKRDQLHQMWLEKQDAAATDDVLQRLKCGWKQKETPSFEDDDEDEESDDDSEDEEDHLLLPKNISRINSKKMKEMIPQMFTDKNDTFLSSDDEETEQKLVRQRFAEKAEEQGSFLSPADDESSREVFGLIKKLNVAPDTKRKQKPSIFDMLISGGNSNSSSKSSFLGRAKGNSLPTSRKHGSSTARSYIFGRDDSNSRSEVSTSEVSLDVVEKQNHTTKIASAKFSSSQSKRSTQITIAETSSRSTLLEILRRSAVQSKNSTPNNMVGQTQNVTQFFSSFKSGKKSMKIERRT